MIGDGLGEMAELDELKGIIRKTIRVRRVTLAIFFLIALAVKLGLEIPFPVALLLAPLVWFLMTFPFKFLVEEQQEQTALHHVHLGFFLFELILITYLIHLMEGIEWIGVVFYLFTVIYANFFLPRPQGYFVTGFAVLLYSGLVVLEYFGVVGHRTLFNHRVPDYQALTYIIPTVLAGAVGIYAAVSYTIQIFSEIYRKKNRSLQDRERRLHALSSQLISAGEEERRRISRALHDEVGQALTVVKMQLDGMQHDSEDLRLGEAGRLIDETWEKIRELSYALRPPMLDELGLVPTLRWLVDQFERTAGIEITLQTDGLERRGRLDPQVEVLLYRVTQEALSNIRKHANADHALVQLEMNGPRIRLRVRDDGRGFEVVPIESLPPGLGLRGMREQVTLIGGRFQIDSQPGDGTEIRLEIPIDTMEQGR